MNSEGGTQMEKLLIKNEIALSILKKSSQEIVKEGTLPAVSWKNYITQLARQASVYRKHSAEWTHSGPSTPRHLLAFRFYLPRPLLASVSLNLP